MRSPFLSMINAFLMILSVWLVSGCETMDQGNPLDFVPVDDLGGEDCYSEPVPVADPEAREPRLSVPAPRAEAAPRRQETPAPRKTVIITDEEDLEEPDVSAEPVREMQRPSFSGLSASAPVPAFGEAPKRFVKDEYSGSVQAVDTPSTPPLQPKVVPAARVMHVNSPDHYVILQCEKMPSPGEDAQIYRGEELVGEVRFVSNRKGRYIVADIVSGDPQRGDVARYKCLFPQKEEPAEKKKDPEPGAAREKKRGRGMPLFF